MATIPSGHGLKHKLTLIFQPYPVPIISSRTDDFIYHNHIEFEVIGIWHLNSNVNILVFKKEKKIGFTLIKSQSFNHDFIKYIKNKNVFVLWYWSNLFSCFYLLLNMCLQQGLCFYCSVQQRAHFTG